MYLAAEGAKAQSRRLEVISNNMANVDTVGFKPEVTAFQARYAEAIQQRLVQAGDGELPDIGGGVKVIETVTDFSAGKLRQTGNDSDLAIIGEGFFQVEADDPNDPPLLTRAGAFSRDALGMLVMAGSNRHVLDVSGKPIELLPDRPWSVTPDGAIEQGAELIPLALVNPNDLGELQKAGANFFRARGEVLPVPPERREVRSGFLEMSGANSTEQLLEMIETNRAFEANTKMIQHQDGATGQLISRVLSR